MRIKVHVRGIKGSSTIQEGEAAQVLVNGVLEVDGHLIDEVTEIEVSFVRREFVVVMPHLLPGSFEVVTHTEQSWERFLDEIDQQKEAFSGTGRLLARIMGKEE